MNRDSHLRDWPTNALRRASRACLIAALAALLTLLALPSTSDAQSRNREDSCVTQAREARATLSADGLTPHVVASMRVSLSHTCDVISFYRRPAQKLPLTLPEGVTQEEWDNMRASEKRASGVDLTPYDLTPRFMIRRYQHQSIARTGVPETIGWRDTDQCPAIFDALEDLEQIAGRGVTAGPKNPELSYIMTDGTPSTLWIDDKPDDFQHIKIEIIGNANEVSAWMTRTLRALNPCWNTTPEAAN